LKNGVNVELGEKKYFGILKVTDEKSMIQSRIRIRILGYGSLPKCHGPGTLVFKANPTSQGGKLPAAESYILKFQHLTITVIQTRKRLGSFVFWISGLNGKRLC
jgi:hypothetical protein